ncbi:MAG: flagellar biosynthesis anti-sigma factor FlgM [Desulfobacula sp.]|nr:flagellar biosynthesis anti-sigma factor FlgM [Desulfobacula sp.]
MKISNSTPNYINQAYGNKANNPANQDLKSQRSGEEALTDSINLSHRTKDLQKISKAMDITSVDREKYVADIKQQVETNQYNMNADTVAQKMVGHLMNGIV